MLVIEELVSNRKYLLFKCFRKGKINIVEEKGSKEKWILNRSQLQNISKVISYNKKKSVFLCIYAILQGFK